MIQLRFNSMAGTDALIVGPAPFFRIEGFHLHRGPHGEPIGRYRDHHWEIDGRYVSSYECFDRSCLRLEDRTGALSRVHGPFQQLRFPNGCCYVDDTLFAELSEDTEQWVCRADRTAWSSIVISPAD